MSPYPPVDERPALLSPDEYIALLVERAREADEQSRAERTAAGLPPAPACQQRRDWAGLDRSIERVVRLQNRRVAVVAKLHRAEAREAS